MSTDLILSGNIYVDRLTDAGVSTGYLEPAEIGTLEIGEKTDLKTRKSKGRDTYGQVTATVSLKQPATLKVTLNSVDADTLAIALLGEAASANQTGADIAAAEFTPILNQWVKLPHSDLSEVVAKAPTVSVASGSPATLTLGTDFEINYRLGMIKVTTALQASKVYSITYSTATKTITRVSGSVKPTVKMRLMLDGKNLVTGDDVRVTIDEATLTPSKAIDFMSDDWAQIELEGEMTTLTGKTSPYTVDIVTA